MSSAIGRRVNICVVGCGHWGKNLARNFSVLGHLHSICESGAERLQSFATLYPSAKAYARLEDALADSELDAVALATPAEEHCKMALAALRAGKDVFVEKPLTLDWKDGVEMVETAHSNGRILMVGHLLRYHPAILKVQELVARECFGRIEYIYSNRLSMGKIRREENALWSFAPHDISVILALVGQLPMQVTATGGAYLQPNIADVTVSNLLFDRGTRSHIFVSWLHPYKEQRLVVVGSKQMVVFEDTRPDDKLILYDKRIEWKDGVIEGAKTHGVPVLFDTDEPLRRECQHFIDCVSGRRQPLTPGEEGVRVLQVLQACQRSLQMNGEPVKVDAATAQTLLRL
jgi:UDP-2-acetamido-3-amino-2,3-dideoxy-glucuronate N-acetyltransferase